MNPIKVYCVLSRAQLQSMLAHLDAARPGETAGSVTTSFYGVVVDAGAVDGRKQISLLTSDVELADAAHDVLSTGYDLPPTSADDCEPDLSPAHKGCQGRRF